MKSDYPKKTQPDVYNKLVRAIAEGDAIVMVGAGSSVRIGFPNWENLLDGLSNVAAKKDPSRKKELESLKKKYPLTCASKIKEILGAEDFYSQLQNIFGPENPKYDEFHELLVQLPFRHFMTTNYDRTLQTAHENINNTAPYVEFDPSDPQQQGSQLVDTIGSKNANRHFIHVHGSIKNPKGIILAAEDYDERYSKNNEFIEVLKQIFTRKIIFIGFSLNDTEFLGPLKFLTACLGKGEPRHFALLKNPDQDDEILGLREHLRQRYRIEPLFYDPQNSHAVLIPLLKELKTDIANCQGDLIKDSIAFLANISGEESKLADIVRNIGDIESVVRLDSLCCTNTNIHDSVTRTGLDSEIDSIFSYVKNGYPEIAIEMYKSILGREGDNLSKRLKYRLHANTGNALNSMNKPREAAEEYRIATDYWSDTKDAKALRALGHILNREFSKSLEITEKVCKEYPDFPRGHALRLQSMPRSYPFKDARESVPLKIRRNSEVALVLSGIASEQGLRKRSEVYGRIAWKGSPDWIEAGLSYATELLITEKGKAIISGGTKFIPRNIDRLKEAESILTGLLAKLEQSDPAKMKGIIFFNRASTRRFLGLEAEARSDIEQAFHCDRNNPETISAYVLQRERDAGRDEAIRILDEYEGTKNHPSLSFFLSNMLIQRSGHGDLDRALLLLMPWCEKIQSVNPTPHRYDFFRLISDLLRKLDRTEDAVSIVNKITEPSLPSSYKQLLLLWIQIESDTIDLNEAKRTCENIYSFFGGEADYFITREIALCAHKIKHYPLSFNLWRKITYPHDYNSDTQYLFAAAKEIKEFKFIIDWCTQLRQNNIHERNCYIHEIEANIECHEFNEAVSLMLEWLRHSPGDKETRMNLSLLAAEIGKKEHVESNPDNLPFVDAVPNASYGARVVKVLSHSDDKLVPIVYAYNLWRRFPDDIIAQHTLISTSFMCSKDKSVFPVPTHIECGSAVVYKANDSDERHTHIIEESTSPFMSRDEYPPSHPVSIELLGKKVGESFTISRRTWEITEIHNKYSYIAFRLLQSFNISFPNNLILREFKTKITTDTAANPQEALSEVKEFLAAEEKAKKHLEHLYQTDFLPVLTFAKSIGKSVLETMQYLASSANHKIRVYSDTNREFETTCKTLLPDCQIVLDETAIATLFMLGMHKELAILPFKLIVPEAAIYEIQQIINRAVSTGPSTYLGISNGILVHHDVSPTEHACLINSLEELVVSLQEHCSIQGGKALAEFDPVIREHLINNLGPPNADAIAIAKQNGATYWTDDLITGTSATNVFGVRRVWSQVVIHQTMSLNKGFVKKYKDALKKMFLWGYDFTRIGIPTIISIYKDAGWNNKDYCFKYTEDFVAKVGSLNPENCRTTGLLIVWIWQSCPNKTVACNLITGLLNKIGKSDSGPKIARPIYRGQIKLPNTRKIRNLKRMLRAWRMNAGSHIAS